MLLLVGVRQTVVFSLSSFSSSLARSLHRKCQQARARKVADTVSFTGLLNNCSFPAYRPFLACLGQSGAKIG